MKPLSVLSLAGMLFLLGPCSAQDRASAPPLTTHDILKRVADHKSVNQEQFRYTENRHYVLRNTRFNRNAEMDVKATHRADGSVEFAVLQVSGFEEIFKRILEGETALSRLPGAEKSLNEANYDFSLIGAEIHRGRECYVLQLVPRRKSKYLLQGRAWIAADTFDLVRIEGTPSASLGFWVGRPFISQEFTERGGAWVLLESHSTASTRLLGSTELSIVHREHTVLGSAAAGRRHGQD